MSEIKPSTSSNWIDAVIAAGFDPRDLPSDMEDVCRRVFDFGADCGRLDEADTITALRERVKVLEGALEPFAKVADECGEGSIPSKCYVNVNVGMLRAARVALKGGE